MSTWSWYLATFSHRTAISLYCIVLLDRSGIIPLLDRLPADCYIHCIHHFCQAVRKINLIESDQLSPEFTLCKLLKYVKVKNTDMIVIVFMSDPGELQPNIEHPARVGHLPQLCIFSQEIVTWGICICCMMTPSAVPLLLSSAFLLEKRTAFICIPHRNLRIE